MNREVRILTVVHALQLMAEGKGKAAACEQAGLTTRTFDRWMAKQPGIRAGFSQTQQQELEAKYAELSQANRLAMDRLIRMARTGVDEHGELLQPRDLVALQRQITALLQGLQLQMGLTEQAARTVSQLPSIAEVSERSLVGAALHPGKSPGDQTAEITSSGAPLLPDTGDGSVSDE